MPFIFRCNACGYEHEEGFAANLEMIPTNCRDCGMDGCPECILGGLCDDCLTQSYDDDDDWDSLDDDILFDDEDD